MSGLAKVMCVCETCGASFEAHRNDIKTCPAHRKRNRMPAEKVMAPGSSAVSWVPGATFKLNDWIDQYCFAHDAANECVHGALPHDRVIPKGCKCWPADDEQARRLLETARRVVQPDEYELSEQRATRAAHERFDVKPVEEKPKKRSKRKAA